MNFLEPLGLLGLTALIPVIALYFLKLKREERVVPSTLLWKKVIDDMQVNAPFQRLKYSMLLLIQLLLVAVLGFALARPYLSQSGNAGNKTILLIDTSASMSTRDGDKDGKKTRLNQAQDDARGKIDAMKHNDEIMIVAFDRDVRQLSKFSSDSAQLKQVLGNLETRDVDTRANEAFETAMSLCENAKDVQVLVLSDGCFGSLKLMKEKSESTKAGNIEDNKDALGAATELERIQRRLKNFRFVSYGDDVSDNVAITQIDARTRPVKTTAEDGSRVDAVETQIFVMIENFAPPNMVDGREKPRDIVLSLATSGQRFAPKVISLKGRASRTETLGDTSGAGNTADASRSVEVFKLPLGTTGVVTAHIDAPKDKFPADDTANVVVGSSEGIKLLLVSKGNYFLEKALSAMRGVAVERLTPEAFTTKWDQSGGQKAVEQYDACIFEEIAPISWPEGGALFLGSMPPLPGFVKAEKMLDWPVVLDWDISHPVMRYVNFGNVTVSKSQAWTVPKTAKVIVEGSGGPLITSFETDRLRAIGISFDVFSSDWAYRPSLPLFLRNVVPWLAEASPRRHPTAQRTGETLMVPPGLGGVLASFHRPGETPEKIQTSAEHSTFIKGTEKAGLYYLRDLPGGERVYAVNLASRLESSNAAQGSLKINDLSVASTPSAVEAKREIWKDLAIGAAALLMLEWWVFHRRVGL